MLSRSSGLRRALPTRPSPVCPPSTCMNRLMGSKDCESQAGYAGWWESGWYVNRRDCWRYVPHCTPRRRLTGRTTRECTSIRGSLLRDGEPYNLMRIKARSWWQKHPDGRISNPLILINWYILPYHPWMQTLIIRAPSSSPTDLMTLHASMLSNFQQVVEVSKVRKLIQWAKEELTDRY